MLVHPNIDPVAFAIGPLKVHWYGLMYLFGFAGAWAFARYRGGKDSWRGVTAAQSEDLIFYGALGAVVGGRLGYVFFYQFGRFLEDPLWLFQITDGGMSFHGGFLGVLFAIWLFSRKINRPIGEVYDFIAPLAPIGLFFGRIGNFIGQELYGRASDVPWATVFFTDPERLPRHPSQLYEAILEGLLLFVILALYSAKPRARWTTASLFVLAYGLFRFLVEFTRQPDDHIGFDLFGWISRGQLLSLPMILVGATVFYLGWRKNQLPDLTENEKKP